MNPGDIAKVQELVTTFLHSFRKQMEKCEDGDSQGYINLIIAVSAFEKLIMKDLESYIKEDMSDKNELKNILDSIRLAADEIVKSVPEVKKQVNKQMVN